MKLKHMILVALFAALTAAGAFIRIPMPLAPITLQTLASLLAGMLLGPWLGALSQVLYLAIGLVGVPVFAQGGGIGYVLQPSFGYLLGLVFGAAASGALARQGGTPRFMRALLAALAGTAVIYAIGVPYLYGMMNLYLHKGLTVGRAVTAGLLIFLPGDVLKAVAAALVFVKLKPALSKSGLILS